MQQFFQWLAVYTAVGVTIILFSEGRKRIRKKPCKEDEEVIRQEISDKLDKLIKDVKSTIQS